MMQRTLVFIALIVVAGSAAAHSGHDPLSQHGASFAAGFAHPFGGIDHLLVLLSVGLWAAQSPSRILAPALFMTGLSAGALGAACGFTLPFIEHGIAISVLAAGLLLAFVPGRGRIARVALALVTLGAAFHGYAHFAEAPSGAALATYSVGFGVGNLLLLALGMLLGTMLQSSKRDERLRRFAGVAVAIGGSALLLNL